MIRVQVEPPTSGTLNPFISPAPVAHSIGLPYRSSWVRHWSYQYSGSLNIGGERAPFVIKHAHGYTFKSSRIKTINRRSLLTTLHCSHNPVGRKTTPTLLVRVAHGAPCVVIRPYLIHSCANGQWTDSGCQRRLHMLISDLTHKSTACKSHLNT